jgi:hypothetical protein
MSKQNQSRFVLPRGAVYMYMHIIYRYTQRHKKPKELVLYKEVVRLFFPLSTFSR